MQFLAPLLRGSGLGVPATLCLGSVLTRLALCFFEGEWATGPSLTLNTLRKACQSLRTSRRRWPGWRLGMSWWAICSVSTSKSKVLSGLMLLRMALCSLSQTWWILSLNFSSLSLQMGFLMAVMCFLVVFWIFSLISSLYYWSNEYRCWKCCSSSCLTLMSLGLNGSFLGRPIVSMRLQASRGLVVFSTTRIDTASLSMVQRNTPAATLLRVWWKQRRAQRSVRKWKKVSSPYSRHTHSMNSSFSLYLSRKCSSSCCRNSRRMSSRGEPSCLKSTLTAGLCWQGCTQRGRWLRAGPASNLATMRSWPRQYRCRLVVLRDWMPLRRWKLRYGTCVQLQSTVPLYLPQAALSRLACHCRRRPLSAPPRQGNRLGGWQATLGAGWGVLGRREGSVGEGCVCAGRGSTGSWWCAATRPLVRFPLIKQVHPSK